MKTNILNVLRVVGLCWLAPGFDALAAGNPDAGKQKFYTCRGCHSIPGYSNTYPNYHVPNVGGQHTDYIVVALQAYQQGTRKHKSMQGNADGLTNQEMEDIAAYLSPLESPDASEPYSGDPVVGKKKASACGSCHGEDGNSDNAMFPKLAGQYSSYIVKALKNYKTGARKNAMMNGMAETLSEEDMEDIAAFYASQKKGLVYVED